MNTWRIVKSDEDGNIEYVSGALTYNEAVKIHAELVRINATAEQNNTYEIRLYMPNER